MKSWEEIRNQICENKKKIKLNNNFIREQPFSKRNEAKKVELAREVERLSMENHILHENARLAYMAEILPGVLNILNGFAGKPFGPKTKEKANNISKKELSCAFYFDGSNTLELVPLNDNGYSGTMFRYSDFEIQRRRQDGDSSPAFLDENNKVIRQSDNIEDYRLINCGDYVEDVTARAELIKTLFNELKQKHDDLSKSCEALNELLPSRIDYVHAGYFRNYLNGA